MSSSSKKKQQKDRKEKVIRTDDLFGKFESTAVAVIKPVRYVLEKKKTKKLRLKND